MIKQIPFNGSENDRPSVRDSPGPSGWCELTDTPAWPGPMLWPVPATQVVVTHIDHITPFLHWRQWKPTLQHSFFLLNTFSRDMMSYLSAKYYILIHFWVILTLTTKCLKSLEFFPNYVLGKGLTHKILLYKVTCLSVCVRYICLKYKSFHVLQVTHRNPWLTSLTNTQNQN